MAVRKLSISMPEDIAEAAAEQARFTGQSLSAWVTNVVLARLNDRVRLEIGRRAAEELLAEAVAKHGPLTPDERAWADQALATVLGEPEASATRDAG